MADLEIDLKLDPLKIAPPPAWQKDLPRSVSQPEGVFLPDELADHVRYRLRLLDSKYPKYCQSMLETQAKLHEGQAKEALGVAVARGRLDSVEGGDLVLSEIIAAVSVGLAIGAAGAVVAFMAVSN